MDKKLEIEIIKRFVDPKKKNRLLDFVSKPEKRDRIFYDINSPTIFDQKYITEISGAVRNPVDLVKKYKELGMGGRVYIMSENDDWDGKKFQMSYIVGECLAMCLETIGYCWKTKTAFFEWHHSGASYFLKRH